MVDTFRSPVNNNHTTFFLAGTETVTFVRRLFSLDEEPQHFGVGVLHLVRHPRSFCHALLL